MFTGPSGHRLVRCACRGRRHRRGGRREEHDWY
jgi:hypothetical protein